MKKLLIVFALLGIVLVSGCTGNATGMAITGEEDNGVVYHQDICRQDTDCTAVYCSETPEDLHCMSVPEMLQDFKCNGKGRLITMKDYDVCGCVEGICRAK